MPARAPKGMLEDSYQRLLLNDFSGGLNTYTGAISLPSNASPDMLNVIPTPGRLRYRGGYNSYSPLTHTADQVCDFYDTAGTHHYVVWENGAIVDVYTGAEVAVTSNGYTAGQRVGCCTISGVLYWSTQTVPLQYWNPVANTHGAVVQTGATTPPCSPYLFVYAGSIVAAGVNYVPATPADYQPTVMGWSVPNQPGNWDAASSQAVGPLIQGATLEFAIVLGVANTGVPPTRTIVVGRSDIGIIAYTGALGSLTENAVNCPVGCKDGASAVFCPGSDGFGDDIFLGTDNQFWKSNGINAVVASLDVQNLVQTQASYATAGSRFFAGYNEEYCYYFCQVNTYQFVYKWDIAKWTVFTGWPSGPLLNTTDSNGLPALFVASNISTQLGFFQIGLDRKDDNGTPPSVYYKSPWLHAGDPELLKVWHYLALLAYNTGTTYQVTVAGLARSNDGSQMVSAPMLFGTSGVLGTPFILNYSLLNGPDRLQAGGLSTAPIAPPQTPVLMRGRIACPVVWEQDSMCRGLIEEVSGGSGAIYEALNAVAIQICVAYYSDEVNFDVLGIQTRFLSRGYRREGGFEYASDMGVTNPNDPFVYNNLTPADPMQSG